MVKKLLGGLALVIAGLWLWNASFLARPAAGTAPKLLSHRGVHQTYHRDDLDRDTCTASRIDTPQHDYLENTLPSMAAAFAAGADVVELDIHLTADGRFAVFHDWTVDCRTDGSGETRAHSMDELKRLDIGHGYSADGGRTHPFRGTGTGLMPTLAEVMEAFPDGRFLINLKSSYGPDGEALAQALRDNPDWQTRAWGVYGGHAPTMAVTGAQLDIRGYSRETVKACFTAYLAMGWTGAVPEPCRETIMIVPVNARHFVWGWPHRFTRRMEAAGTTVILLGPYEKGDPGTTGIDTPDLLDAVPARFNGYVWTNRIEVIGPLMDEHR